MLRKYHDGKAHHHAPGSTTGKDTRRECPTPRAAMALAKPKAYQDAADAPVTLKAYATDRANFEAWCSMHGFMPMPATPAVVGAYLAAVGEDYALPTLRRRVAAIARACRLAGHPLDTKAPAIRETLHGIGRTHGIPPRRSAALTTTNLRKLVRACGTTLAGARDMPSFSSPSPVPCAVRNRSA